ncbi:MAG: hypothetical protein ACTHMG_01275 [Sphingomonas sp.]
MDDLDPSVAGMFIPGISSLAARLGVGFGAASTERVRFATGFCFLAGGLAAGFFLAGIGLDISMPGMCMPCIDCAATGLAASVIAPAAASIGKRIILRLPHRER